MARFEAGDLVFAKMKGYSYWPAQVEERAPGKTESYKVKFFGTDDLGFIKPEFIVAFTPESLKKYGKNQRKPGFKEGMEEIQAEAAKRAANGEKDKGDVSEGELMIDENPLPPVLKPEVELNRSHTAKPMSSTPANVIKKAVRRSSKNKRESVLQKEGSASPPTPEEKEKLQPEIVSRSGRKIKPKRFADDEIATPSFTKTQPRGSKGGKSTEKEKPKGRKSSFSGDSDGPTPKRAKRAPVVKPAPKKADSESSKTKALPKVLKKSSSVEKKTSVPKDGELDVSSSNLVLAKKSAPNAPTADRFHSVQNTLEAGNNSDATNATEDVVNESDKAAVDVTYQEENIGDDTKTDESINNEQEKNKGNGDENASDDGAEKMDDDQVGLPRQEDEGDAIEVPNIKMEASEDDVQFNESGDLQCTFEAKNGFQMVLTCPEEEIEDSQKREQKAESLLKLKEELQKSAEDANEVVNRTADSVITDPAVFEAREERDAATRTLRLEGEMIEIIGEIANSLHVKSADCSKALELLSRLRNHEISGLMLKKHLEVVATIRKLSRYVGNPEEWSLEEPELSQFKSKSEEIRTKAGEIYDSFKQIFCSDSSDKNFSDVFDEEVKRFVASTEGMSRKEVLKLTVDPEAPEAKAGEDSVVKVEDMDSETGNSPATGANDEAISSDCVQQNETHVAENEVTEVGVQADGSTE